MVVSGKCQKRKLRLRCSSILPQLLQKDSTSAVFSVRATSETWLSRIVWMQAAAIN